MKSILKVCFTIIISILLSIGISMLMNTVIGRESLVTTYTADFAPPNNGGEVWFDDLRAHSSWYCAEHGVRFPVETTTEIELTGTIAFEVGATPMNILLTPTPEKGQYLR